MTNPTFECKGNKFVFFWPDYKLRAEVGRIHANHERTTCQLIFTSTHEAANPHILQARFNLDSSRSRAELAKEMAVRYKLKEPVDWKMLLEYLSVKTLREFESGEPMLELTSVDEVEALKYLVAPIAPLHKPTVIFGDPGSGKSQFAIILNMVVGLPWHTNPLRLTAPTERVVSLFLDYEADPEDMRRQLRNVATGMGIPFLSFYYRRCHQPLADDLEAIMNHAESIHATCLFIDSISLAAGGDLNKMEFATEYFRALRQIGMTSISLAHTSKERESKTKTILGSVLFEAGARSVWEARGQEDEKMLDIALFHRKANLSQKAKPLGYRITYGEESTTIAWHDPRSVPEFVERMGPQERIKKLLLSEGELSMEEITEDLGLTLSNAKMAVSRLRAKGILRKGLKGYMVVLNE